jgi:uncharacterized repeat protein (TIGR01451 family)
MRSEKSGSNVRRLAALTAVVAVALLTLVSAAPAPGGTKPNRLDDNRGNLAAQVAVNSFVSLPPIDLLFLPIPILLPPPIGPLTPRVLENPSIHNVFWDSDWNDHHSGDFSTDSIDAMTQKLVDSNYFDFAGQYDVGHASFDGSDTAGGILNPCSSDPGSTTNFVDILFFIECETSLAPTGVPSPTAGPFGGNDLYVVYLPKGTTIDNFGINKSCDGFGAYHFLGTTLTLLGGAQVTFAAIPLDCANNDPDQLSELVSHEVIEAATDPNVVMGWIDNSKFDLTNLTPLFTEGEAADICESIGDEPADPVRLDSGILVAPYWSNADDACVPFPTADLEVTKSDSPDPVIAGEQLYYTVSVTNHGPNDVSDVSLTDHLPSQVQFVTDDRGICSGGTTLTCNFGKVLNGKTSTVVIKTKVKANAVPSAGAIGITNTAEVSSVTVIDPNTDNNSASASTIVEDRADLRVTKLCKPDGPMLAGDVATCTIFVDNNGPSDARDVKVVDAHVSNRTFTILGASASPGAACPAIAGVVTCDLGTEPAGGRTTITVTETATEAQDVNDCAKAASATPDPDTANNQACDGVTILAVSDLSLTKADAPDPLVAGTDITYTLQVHNSGPSTAPNVVIRDQLPNSVTVISIASVGGTCVPGVPGDPGQPARCTYGAIAPTLTRTMLLVVRVNPGNNTVVTNAATVASDVLDPDLSNNSASATTSVRIADLGLVTASDAATYKASAQITYTLTVVNNGPGNAENVVVTDPLPLSANDRVAILDPSCTLAGFTATCTLGAMAPLTSRALTIAIVPKGKTGYISNTATLASTTFDPFASNNSSTKVVLSGSPPKP